MAQQHLYPCYANFVLDIRPHPALMSDSDSLYHRLFSHPRMVEELVRQFVSGALCAGLDFSGLQQVNPKFPIGRRSAARREGDVIWRLPIRKGIDIYLYLLIEFQSQSDEWMAVRTQVYQGLLWQQVIREQKVKSGARLPPLLLLVLHNGAQRWSAPTEINELVALEPDSPLWHWQPQARYHLLDMGAVPEDALLRHSSWNGSLRRSSAGFAGMRGFRELKGLFSELVRQAIRRTGTRAWVPEELLEMKTNLIATFKAFKKHCLAEGKAIGLAEGLARGKAEALVRLLVSRFGTVPLSSANESVGLSWRASNVGLAAPSRRTTCLRYSTSRVDCAERLSRPQALAAAATSDGAQATTALGVG